MTKAFVSGDSTKVANYLADDFKAYNGVSIDSNDKGQDKESFSKSSKGWKNALDYFSIERTKGAYPDAIKYKDNNQKEVVWVQTWEDLKGVHKKTGVKINMPIHRLFVVNGDNKIQTIITYSNSSISDEIRASYTNRTNGTIYNHHENINTVRNIIGYPDYLEYEMDNGREVLSWWNYHLIRKSDKKEIKIPMHMSNSFDKEGKIVG